MVAPSNSSFNYSYPRTGAPCNSSSFTTYVANLTSSYADRRNEATMVSSTILILVLAGSFFNLIILGRFSDLSAVRNRRVQRFLSSVLSIFLPVMSYLFSEAKNSDPHYTYLQRSGLKPDLPQRAGVILVWMLLVELLRNNVEEIRMRGYETSGLIQRAGRVVWLGSLVFSNVRSPGRKAVFGGLWILCASKLVQRVAFTEVGKRSYVHNKNSRLIASYNKDRRDRRAIVHTDAVEAEHAVPVEPANLLERCEYIVTGEEKLVKEATAHGYKVNHDDNSIVTVGKVWAELSNRGDEGFTFTICDGHERLRKLSLSFALFKLLRRRFEYRGEMSVEEARDCRDLLFKGLCNNGGEATREAEAVFHVMNDEVNFLREYYHSVVPVVLASPFFLLANYLLLLAVLLGLWLMIIILCGNGDLSYAFRSIITDNYALKFGIIKLTKCLLKQATTSPQVFFSTVDLSITFLLFVIFLYEEVREFVLFILSNWFVISLIRNYISKPKWRECPAFVAAFRCIMWVRSKIHHRKLRFKQFSVLNLRRLLILPTPGWPGKLFWTAVQSIRVPGEVKHYIIQYLMEHDHRAVDGACTLSNGMSALENKHADLFPHLSWACESESAAEVILTWHIATSLILQKLISDSRSAAKVVADSRCDTCLIWQKPVARSRSTAEVVATSLSEYCAYLVVFHPELLPDNKDKTERVFKDMKKELRRTLGFVDYYFSGQDARAKEILGTVQEEECCWTVKKVLKNGAKLAKLLLGKIRNTVHKEECSLTEKTKVLKNGTKLAKLLLGNDNPTTEGRGREVWQVLADVWTELMVYVAPSNDEVQVKGHESLLVHGAEFVTLLWALTTHTGFSRPATPSEP